MIAEALVTLGGAVFMAAVGSLLTIRLWRNETALFDSPPRLWPLSERSWPRVTRAFPVGVLGMAAALAAVVPLGFVDRPCTGAGCTVVAISAVVAIACFTATVVLFFAVALFGRPASLVPPHMRSSRRSAAGRRG